MLPFPPVLAHGALGSWDELIFMGIVIIFFGLIVVSWIRSSASELPPDSTANPQPTDKSGDGSGDRFKLD